MTRKYLGDEQNSDIDGGKVKKEGNAKSAIEASMKASKVKMENQLKTPLPTVSEEPAQQATGSGTSAQRNTEEPSTEKRSSVYRDVIIQILPEGSIDESNEDSFDQTNEGLVKKPEWSGFFSTSGSDSDTASDSGHGVHSPEMQPKHPAVDTAPTLNDLDSDSTTDTNYDSSLNVEIDDTSSDDNFSDLDNDEMTLADISPQLLACMEAMHDFLEQNYDSDLD